VAAGRIPGKRGDISEIIMSWNKNSAEGPIMTGEGKKGEEEAPFL